MVCPLLITFLTAHSNTATDINKSLQTEQNLIKLHKLRAELLKLEDKKLENEWIKTYAGYITHKELIDRKNAIETQIKRLENLKSLTKIQAAKLKKLENQDKILQDKISLIKASAIFLDLPS